MQKQNKLNLVLLGVLVFMVVSYIYLDLKESKEDVEEVITDDSTKNSLIENVIITDENNVAVETTEVKIEKEFMAMPDLNRELVFSDEYPEQAKKIIRENIGKIISDLKNNPNVYEDWIALGLQYKGIDDYEGARLTWEYATYLNPDKFLAWGNLGDLYAFYIRDNVKAEQAYIKAIENGSHQVVLYFKISEFYTEFLNNPERARELVNIGIKQNPDSQELKDLLKSI
ncbi:MAG: hypothetical protein V1851_03410 [Patescibacteria group bacterium]